MSLSRRSFLAAAPAALLPALPTLGAARQAQPPAPLSPAFPSQPPDLVREMVGASHGNVARVRELLALRPALAKAAWDWGYGDWESALGAASHVGNVEIAALLIEAGARPTLFSAAMLGQLDVVRAFVSASPGIQRTRGPHGITLGAHSRAGGERAAPVAAFLATLGDADIEYPAEPLADADRDALVGAYAYGAGAADRFAATVHPRFGLQLAREGAPARRLIHLGRRVFHPIGAEAVRIAFAAGSPCPALSVVDGDLAVAASRT